VIPEASKGRQGFEMKGLEFTDLVERRHGPLLRRATAIVAMPGLATPVMLRQRP
jgi:hypothetical protein